MWMEDKNQDGIVDIFETEITVKSNSPIDIKTEEKPN